MSLVFQHRRLTFEPLESREMLSIAQVDSWTKPVALNDTLIYIASDAENGKEIWKSDGTEDGTTLLKDIRPGTASSEPSQLTVCGDAVYFTANNGSSGVELWKTNGTASGTVLVKDIWGGVNSSGPDKLTAAGSTLFFIADNGVNGTELWKSDGTASGTVMVKDIWSGINSGCGWSSELCAVGNTLFFSAQTAEGNYELWKSDGTANGTVLVKEIRSGVVGSYPAQMIAVGNTLYFTADDGGTGTELWKSDGTAAGTVLLKDIKPGSSGSIPAELIAAGSTLYFTADNGQSGYELWKSDGSTNGTILVKEIQSGSKGSNPTHLTALGSSIYFAADDGTNGVELWKSDGSANGTILLKDIRSGATGSNPTELAVVGNTVFFVANDGANGVEIWKTNGTSSGTTLVKNIRSGSLGSNPFHLTALKSTLYFAATDDHDAAQFFKSDGTEDGTNRVIPYKIRPIAKIDNATTLKVQEGCSFLLTANGSQDPAEKGLTYLWDFGDGKFTVYPDPTVWFSAENLDGKPSARQTIRLKVRDAEGTESDVVSADVAILDCPPTISFNQPQYIAREWNHLTFEASDVKKDCICEWEIDWGDGSKTEFFGGPRNRIDVSHLYFEAKNYAQKITVTDDDGIVFSFTHPISVMPAQTPVSADSLPAEEIAFDASDVTLDNISENQRFVIDYSLREETEYLELMGKNSYNSGVTKTMKPVFTDDFDSLGDDYEWLGVTESEQRNDSRLLGDKILAELLEDYEP